MLENIIFVVGINTGKVELEATSYSESEFKIILLKIIAAVPFRDTADTASSKIIRQSVKFEYNRIIYGQDKEETWKVSRRKHGFSTSIAGL